MICVKLLTLFVFIKLLRLAVKTGEGWMWAWPSYTAIPPLRHAHRHGVSWGGTWSLPFSRPAPMILFSKLHKILSGYLDPANIFPYDKSKYYSACRSINWRETTLLTCTTGDSTSLTHLDQRIPSVKPLQPNYRLSLRNLFIYTIRKCIHRIKISKTALKWILINT